MCSHPIPPEVPAMNILFERCAGLDVHKQSVVACVIRTAPTGPPQIETRSFGTMTADILCLSDWLAEREVTHVAMESTGVYWKPLFNLLEGTFVVWILNAQHV